MNLTEIIQAIEDYMDASLGVNGEITKRAEEAVKELKANSSETPNNSSTEMSGTFNKDLAMAKILADALANSIDSDGLSSACDELSCSDWCVAHCKEDQYGADADCWLKYAEVMINNGNH